MTPAAAVQETASFTFCLKCGSADVAVRGWKDGTAVFGCADCGHAADVDGFTIGRWPTVPGGFYAFSVGLILSMARDNISRPRARHGVPGRGPGRWLKLVSLAAGECHHAAPGQICTACAARAVEVAIDVEQRGIEALPAAAEEASRG